MSDPYAPPGSQRGTGGVPGGPGGDGVPDPRERRRQLPPSVPHRPSERRPPDPEGQVRTAKLGMRFSLSVLAGLVATMYLPLPWSAAGPVFVLVGVTFGVLALVSAARARLPWPSYVTLGAGMALAGVLLLVQAATLVFWQASSQWQECRDTAVTRAGQQECRAQYEQSVQSFLPGVPAPTQGG